MCFRNIAVLAIAAAAFTSAPAFALSEGTVQRADIARAGAAVSQIQDNGVRAQAENLLHQAAQSLSDGDRSGAYQALNRVTTLTGTPGSVAIRK